MKLQDLHPYDKTIVGLNNLYVVDYKGYFFINSPCIMATDKTISTGRTYLLVDNPKGTGVNMTDVRLIDVYFDEGVINLIVQDILSQKTFTIDQRIECRKDHFKWILIDFDFFFEEISTKIIKTYCGKCDKIKMRHVAQRQFKNSTDDLLDFEF